MEDVQPADQVGVGAVFARGGEPWIAVDQGGAAFAVFVTGTGSRDVLTGFGRYVPGEGWSAAQTLRQAGFPYSARMAVTPDGTSAIAAWRHAASFSDATRAVFASRWSAVGG